jgi:hypothetical protein
MSTERHKFNTFAVGVTLRKNINFQIEKPKKKVLTCFFYCWRFNKNSHINNNQRSRLRKTANCINHLELYNKSIDLNDFFKNIFKTFEIN